MACELQNIMLVFHKENFHILYQEKEKKRTTEWCGQRKAFNSAEVTSVNL